MLCRLRRAEVGQGLLGSLVLLETGVSKGRAESRVSTAHLVHGNWKEAETSGVPLVPSSLAGAEER